MGQAAQRLGFPFKDQSELHATFAKIDANGNGRVSETEFITWWNGKSDTKRDQLRRELARKYTVDHRNDADQAPSA